jgi:hypothetical protein
MKNVYNPKDYNLLIRKTNPHYILGGGWGVGIIRSCKCTRTHLLSFRPREKGLVYYRVTLKVHKREIFYGSDFEFFTIS